MKLRLVAMSAVLVAVLATTTQAQWITIVLPDTPRNSDGTPALSAPTPRTSDGRPDFSGIWRFGILQKIRRPEKLKEFPLGPVGLDWLMPGGEEIPFLPAADAIYKQRIQQFGKGSPTSACLPHGIPYAMLVQQMKIVHTPRVMIILYEEFNDFRQVFTDGRSLPIEPPPTLYGYSIGHWRGDSFVVETNGFNDKSWLDDAGLPHSEALRVTETFTRRDFGHLDVGVTFDDPRTFSRPWSIVLDLDLQPDTELLEYICENERSSAHIVGK